MNSICLKLIFQTTQKIANNNFSFRIQWGDLINSFPEPGTKKGECFPYNIKEFKIFDLPN